MAAVFLYWRNQRIEPAPGTASEAAATQPLEEASNIPPPIGRAEVALDLGRQQLIGVRTVKAVRSNLGGTVRAAGAVRYDETRAIDVNVRTEGWIRDLFVDYTGMAVRRGDALFAFYSPDAFVSEQEYALALTTRERLQSSDDDAKARADALVAAARQRLLLRDVSPEDVREIEATRAPSETRVVRSPASGVVIDKPIVKGAHVMPGQTLYKLADLSVVWVEAQVYEADVASIRVGSRATVAVDAYPGERLSGRAIYISPYLNEQTRTTTVRYEFANARGLLKPGMYASLDIATSGGFGITLPADAVLDSGRERIVFVALGDGRFSPRTVSIGRRVGGDVEVLSGVGEGDEVASGATFFLDSESQLRSSASIVPPAPVASSAVRDSLRIQLRTTPDPPKTGENQFEVSVSDSQGRLVADAEVALQLFMPAMPTMSMPAMRNEVTLAAVSNGIYRGTGQVMMAGRWDATVTVAREGKLSGRLQTTIVAK